ncbi:MAG TPA: FAD-dependent monooxygenase [Polyangiaceae bacterium]|jgi:2-polyprenyl-6-methoxyphenol hydroxylase-like FAD-dependent oxidoreductase
MSPRADSSSSTDVLVAGAGPTGLVLALALAKLGVRARVVDKAATTGTTSRALAVQARTLELYDQLGLADEVVARGLRVPGVNFWLDGERQVRVELGPIGEGKTPYPYALIFPQDEHEALLVERLRAAGGTVERPVELVHLEPSGDGVLAHLRGADGAVEECRASYVAGCDGARSRVRESIRTGFPGGTYEHLFYVADIEARGRVVDGELHVMLDRAGFLGVFPLAGGSRARLVGTIEDAAVRGGREARWEDVDLGAVERAGIQVARVNWFSTYRVHHRVADHFQRGPVFLLGDAAHIHSPVGGQGMNTGIGDAMNLAWKLAAVLGGRAKADVLGTYEPERIAFARRLVRTTDRVFQSVSSGGVVAGVVRKRVLPRVFAAISRTEQGRRFLFRTVSQTAIQYRTSAWSEGHAAGVHGGDRLPWLTDNYAALRSLDWQIHAYGARSAELADRFASRRIPVHSFAALAGGDAAVLLVRPDGYVAAAFPPAGALAGLARYLDTHAIVGR